MAIAGTLEMYEILRGKFDDAPARAIVEVIDKSLESCERKQSNVLATKQDVAELKAELIKWIFIFIFGQFWLIVGTLTGILFAFFRK